MSKGPKYNGRPIGSVEVLARVLGDTETRLRKIAENADFLYRPKKIKKNGKVRDVFDATAQLKELHEKINENLLRRADYPDYLQGGLKEKDYITDCVLHIIIVHGLEVGKSKPTKAKEDRRNIVEEDLVDCYGGTTRTAFLFDSNTSLSLVYCPRQAE